MYLCVCMAVGVCVNLCVCACVCECVCVCACLCVCVYTWREIGVSALMDFYAYEMFYEPPLPELGERWCVWFVYVCVCVCVLVCVCRSSVCLTGGRHTQAIHNSQVACHQNT